MRDEKHLNIYTYTDTNPMHACKKYVGSTILITDMSIRRHKLYNRNPDLKISLSLSQRA
jgi:hypothetical protein